MELVHDENVPVPMRDGTRLTTSVTRPAGSGPFPAVLTRTPYDKTSQKVPGEQWARDGYAFVRQDVRGRYDSPGEFYPFRDDVTDGHDTIEWIASQAWSDGHVGMTGSSHVGTVQYLAAAATPEHLTAAIPEFAPAGVYAYWWRHGGAFRLSFNAAWVLFLSQDNLSHYPARGQAVRALIADAFSNDRRMLAGETPAVFRDWSPASFKAIEGVFGNRWFEEFMEHPDGGDFWRPYDFTWQHASMRTPMLHVGGWFDTFCQGTIDSYAGLAGTAPGQALVVGPWRHVNWGTTRSGQIDFGAAVRDVDPFATRKQWFDHWMRGSAEPPLEGGPVKLFVMGTNVWRDEEAWPIARADEQMWHLHADGGLRPAAPGSGGSLSFHYDPSDPVVTLGGCEWVNYPCGPYDQALLDGRRDVLRFVTEPLDAPVEVTGRIRARLHVASNAPCTDFTAKLVDVHPDGVAYNLCDGVVRSRFDGTDPREVEIDLWSTSNVFGTGHRIRVDVSSSNSPRFAPNPNTGADLADGPKQVARNTVFADRSRPSGVVLPVVRA